MMFSGNSRRQIDDLRKCIVKFQSGYYNLYYCYYNYFPSFRLNVEHHDSLVQHLVSEAWLRIDR